MLYNTTPTHTSDMGKTAEADVPGGGGDNYLNVDSTDRAVSVANPAYEATATFGEEKPQPPPSSPRWKSIAIVLGVVALAFVVLFALAIAGAIGHGASSSTVAASGGDATDGESPTLASFATGEGEAAVEHVCSCDCERFDELDAWYRDTTSTTTTATATTATDTSTTTTTMTNTITTTTRTTTTTTMGAELNCTCKAPL